MLRGRLRLAIPKHPCRAARRWHQNAAYRNEFDASMLALAAGRPTKQADLGILVPLKVGLGVGPLLTGTGHTFADQTSFRTVCRTVWPNAQLKTSHFPNRTIELPLSHKTIT